MKENKKLSISKNNIIFAAFIAIIALISMFAAYRLGKQSKEIEPVGETAIEEETGIEAPGIIIDSSAVDIKDKEDDPFKDRYISYQGLSDLTVEQGDTYQLQNVNTEEDVFMKFSVMLDGQTLEETDFIPCGKAYEADFAKILGVGTHDVTVLMQPYISSEGKMLACPVNNSQQMKVTVNS